ncbi:MAG: hypothetical protein AAF790_00195 [Planctomycetota bacterium]
MGAADWASAQSGSRGSSYSNFQLNRIRQQAIGNQFSSDAIVRQTLAQSTIRAPVIGVGSIDRRIGSTGRMASSVSGASGSVTRVGAPRAPSLGLNRGGRGLGGGQRPFSNLNRRPSISPYLNLFRGDNNFTGSNDDLNYQTLVRPQLQQQQFNRRAALAAQQMNARLQNLAAQPAFAPTGSQTLIPTGSPAAYRFYSHYYPGQR